MTDFKREQISKKSKSDDCIIRKITFLISCPIKNSFEMDGTPIYRNIFDTMNLENKLYNRIKKFKVCNVILQLKQ